MPNRGVLALLCLVACDVGPSNGSLTFSVRRFVDIPRATGVGTLLVQAARTDSDASVTISLDAPPPGLTADPLELPAGTTTASWTLRAVTPIDADVAIVARTSSGLVARSHTRVKSDLVGGLLDESFGDHGVTASLTRSQWSCAAALVQPDGKILILSVGENATAGSVFRITGDGVLDPGYGAAGMAAIPTPQGHGTGVTGGFLQPDGKLVAFGYERYNDAPSTIVPRVWRLTTEGSLDDTFQVDAAFGIRVATVRYAALRADGEIDVVLDDDLPDMSIARLESDGSLDTAFGIGGVEPSFPELPLLLLDDGNWLGLDDAGHVEIATPDGTRVATSEPVPVSGSFVVRPAPGGFLVAGGTPGFTSDVFRLRSDLATEPSFGRGGDFRADFLIQDMALTSDGKIVLEGNGTLERLNPDGSPDASFRLVGLASVSDLFGGQPACPGGLIVGPDDRITFVWTNLAHELRLVRFLP